MKSIKDMEHEEIIALTQTELDRLVRLACAVEGIPLPGPEPEKPEAPAVVRDATVYAVGGLHFSDRNAAEAVSAALSGYAEHAVTVTYDWNCLGSEHQYVKPLKSDDQIALSNISTLHVLGDLNYRKVRESLIQHKALQKQYEDDLKAHEKCVGVTDEIRGEVMAIYNEACRREAEFRRYASIFDEYVRLAAGDIDVAVKFFEKANNPSEWVRERMRVKVQNLRVADAAAAAMGASAAMGAVHA